MILSATLQFLIVNPLHSLTMAEKQGLKNFPLITYKLHF